MSPDRLAVICATFKDTGELCIMGQDGAELLELAQRAMSADAPKADSAQPGGAVPMSALLEIGEHAMSLMTAKAADEARPRLYHPCDGCEKVLGWLQANGRCLNVDAPPRPTRGRNAMTPRKTHCRYGHPYSGDNLRIVATTPARISGRDVACS